MSTIKIKDITAPTVFNIGLLITLLLLEIYGIGIPFLNTMELKAYDLHFRSGER